MIFPRASIRPTLSALLLAALAPSTGAGAADPAPAPAPPLTVAVLNFQTTGESLAGKGAEAAALLNVRLGSAAPGVIFVERQELDKALGEQELGLSGTVTPDTAARVGALTGAKALVTGRLFETGGKGYLVAKLIGTETSRVYSESASFADPAALTRPWPNSPPSSPPIWPRTRTPSSPGSKPPVPGWSGSKRSSRAAPRCRASAWRSASST